MQGDASGGLAAPNGHAEPHRSRTCSYVGQLGRKENCVAIFVVVVSPNMRISNVGHRGCRPKSEGWQTRRPPAARLPRDGVGLNGQTPSGAWKIPCLVVGHVTRRAPYQIRGTYQLADYRSKYTTYSTVCTRMRGLRNELTCPGARRFECGAVGGSATGFRHCMVGRLCPLSWVQSQLVRSV